MSKEEILKRISRNYYGEAGFVNGNNIWLVDPEKLAEFLAELLKSK